MGSERGLADFVKEGENDTQDITLTQCRPPYHTVSPILEHPLPHPSLPPHYTLPPTPPHSPTPPSFPSPSLPPRYTPSHSATPSLPPHPPSHPATPPSHPVMFSVTRAATKTDDSGWLSEPSPIPTQFVFGSFSIKAAFCCIGSSENGKLQHSKLLFAAGSPLGLKSLGFRVPHSPSNFDHNPKNYSHLLHTCSVVFQLG